MDSLLSSSQAHSVLILLPEPEPTEYLANLRTKFPSAEFIFFRTQKPSDHEYGLPEIPAEIWECTTIILTLYHLPSDRSMVPHLKLIHFASSGIDHVSSSSFFNNPSFLITTSAGASSPRIAEWVIMTALIHSHQYQILYEQQKKHLWSKETIEKNPSRHMLGRRLGILGYGCIGQQVARVAQAMGMEIVVYTSSPRGNGPSKTDRFYMPGQGDADGTLPSRWFYGAGKDALHEFLAYDLDFLVISVPLTPKTRHLIGSQEFDLLGGCKQPPFLSSISRGSVVDQKALIKALEQGKICGAAVDVAEPEPLPSSDLLWDAPNIMITPHSSGISSGYYDCVHAIFEANLDRLMNGKPLYNVLQIRGGD